MNINNPTTFSTPDLTLSTSNSSGTAGALRADDTIAIWATPGVSLGTTAAIGDAATGIRSNSTIVGFDASVPGNIALSTAAATGSAAVASRRDHTHGTVDVLLQIKTGFYTGDASSSQTIDDLGILPAFLTINKKNTAAVAGENFDMTNAEMNDNHADGYCYTWGASYGSFVAGKITELNSDGFKVSNDVTTGGSLNGTGNTYEYMAIGY